MIFGRSRLCEGMELLIDEWVSKLVAKYFDEIFDDKTKGIVHVT